MDPFDLVGDVLDGQFRVEEFVGEGGLSVVYRARSETMSAPVAVKCLNLPPTLDDAFNVSIEDAFIEGCKLHFKLARGHLAIAQTFASGSTVAPRTGQQVPYIVREWFDGESLARNLRQRRAEGEHGRSIEETLALFEPIASALEYAHEQDEPHLSLMPSNLFLAKDSDGKVTLKLLDFGVGRVVDDAASTRDGTGAPRIPKMKVLLPTYAAPEQLLGTLGPTGPWTDVYSLALVLLEVLTDRPVNGGKDATAIVARLMNPKERPTPESHHVEAPAQVKAILTRALALAPELRQPTVDELWEELTMAVKPQGVPRDERRRLAVHLRRLRRIRRVEARKSEKPPSLPPPSGEAFSETEPATTKARGVAAMLTARAHRSSTRPPPPAVAVAKKTLPRPQRTGASTAVAPKPRAPTLLGIAAPAVLPVAKPRPSPIPPPPAISVAPAIPPPPIAFPEPTPRAAEPAAVAAPEPEPVAAPVAAPEPAPVSISESALVPEPEPAPAAALFAPPLAAAPIESSGRLEPHEIPVRPSPFALERFKGTLERFKSTLERFKGNRKLLVAAGAGGVLFVALVILVVALASRSSPTAKTTPSASATLAAIPPPPPPTDTAPSPSASTSAQPARPALFNKKKALAAIADATSDLSDCSRKHGVWGVGQVGVTFYNDGTVRRIYMSEPFNGPEGKCVEKHIKDNVRIDPFPGIFGPIYAKFVIPYTP